ncbi:prepilin peptidase [Salmonella enterica]
MYIFISLYLLLNLLLVRADIRSGLLPDKLTCPLLWCGLIWHCCCQVEFLHHAVLGAVAGYASFASLYWGYFLIRRREGLGYGDVKYLSALGAWHGWESLPLLVFCAALFACCAAGVRLFLSRDIMALKNPLPFGPFLAAAGLFVGYDTFVAT